MKRVGKKIAVIQSQSCSGFCMCVCGTKREKNSTHGKAVQSSFLSFHNTFPMHVYVYARNREGRAFLSLVPGDLLSDTGNSVRQSGSHTHIRTYMNIMDIIEYTYSIWVWQRKTGSHVLVIWPNVSDLSHYQIPTQLHSFSLEGEKYEYWNLNALTFNLSFSLWNQMVEKCVTEWKKKKIQYASLISWKRLYGQESHKSFFSVFPWSKGRLSFVENWTRGSQKKKNGHALLAVKECLWKCREYISLSVSECISLSHDNGRSLAESCDSIHCDWNQRWTFFFCIGNSGYLSDRVGGERRKPRKAFGKGVTITNRLSI